MTPRGTALQEVLLLFSNILRYTILDIKVGLGLTFGNKMLSNSSDVGLITLVCMNEKPDRTSIRFLI